MSIRISRSPSARLKPSCGSPSAIMRASEPEPLHQADGDLFEHARANPAEHVIGRLAFQHHAFDPSARSRWPRRRPAGPAPMMQTCVFKASGLPLTWRTLAQAWRATPCDAMPNPRHHSHAAPAADSCWTLFVRTNKLAAMREALLDCGGRSLRPLRIRRRSNARDCGRLRHRDVFDHLPFRQQGRALSRRRRSYCCPDHADARSRASKPPELRLRALRGSYRATCGPARWPLLQ